jgi:hypothetical protein
MTAGFTPPATWTEISTQLRKSGQVTLNAGGVGTLTFQPTSANQRWVVTLVSVSTNQNALATVIPYCTVALNTTDITQLSASNNLGASWDGNNDSFSTPFDVGPCDYFSVLWYPPPGQSGTPLSGVIASALIAGTSYTRRG